MKKTKEAKLTTFSISAEAVTEGHPDRLCDIIANSILDAHLEIDPNTRMKINIVIFGDINSNSNIIIEKVVRQILREVGYDDESKGLNCLTCDILVNIKYHSFLNESKNDSINVVYGYATNETEEFISFPHFLVSNIAKKFSDQRKINKNLMFLHQYAKFLIAVEYNIENLALPLFIKSICIQILYDKDIKIEEVRKLILDNIIMSVVPSCYLDDSTKILINKIDKKLLNYDLISGMSGKRSLTDPNCCKIKSGTDCFRIDIAGTFAARWIAKSLVFNGFCKRVLVYLTFSDDAILSNIKIDSFGSSFLPEKELIEVVLKKFDLKIQNIINTLELKKPINKSMYLNGFYEIGNKFQWESTLKLI